MITLNSVIRRKGTTTKFADFIRNAKADEKKRVYGNVLIEATARQNELMTRQRA